MSLVTEIFDRLVHPNRDPHSVPVLDGPLSPNRLLEQAKVVSPVIPGADDFLVREGAGRKEFLVSSPDGIMHVGDTARLSLATDAAAGALAAGKNGGFYVAIEGKGVAAFDADGHVIWQTDDIAGHPLKAVTALATGPDGRIYVADGSRHNTASRWKRDLMQVLKPSGRIVVLDAATGAGEVLVDGLAWPAGLAVSDDGKSLWFNESWAQRLWSLDLQTRSRQLLVRNFAGYPGRIAAQGDGFWMNFFGMRTELTELVLTERKFREQMIADIPEDLWIGPALSSRQAHLAPTQMGGIKKLGIEKAWAPPRSYGLVALFDAQGDALASWHSRVAGPFHGITSVRRGGDAIYALSKGEGVIVQVPDTETWTGRAS